MNRLQRRYFEWAEPRYARMSPEQREQARAIDRYLYSRRALGFWFGFGAGIGGSTLGLMSVGMPAWLALPCSLMVFGWLLFGGLGAWLQPERFSGRRLWRIALMVMFASYAGVLGSFVERGRLRIDEPERWLDMLAMAAWRATPFQLMVALCVLLLLWTVATVRRQQLQRALAQAQLEAERDAAQRQAAESRLKLLQLQIQPHFLFNTLAAAQHWIDTDDPRAGPLLRSLTQFLRRSVALLDRDSAPLADEAALARSYLEIMGARLGARLQHAFDIAPEAAAQPLPPGVLLSLIENAIEHGIEPALHGGELHLRARRDDDGFVLEVVNSGQPLADGAPEGVGLRNSRERLRGQHGERARLALARLDDGRTAARLYIPAATAHEAATPHTAESQ